MIQINKTTKDETFHMFSDIRFSASAILFSAISRLLSATFLGFINCKTGDSTTIICSKLVKGSIWSTPSGIRLRYKMDWPLLGSLRDFCFVNSSSTRFLSFWLPLTSSIEPLPPPPIVLRDGSGRPLSWASVRGSPYSAEGGDNADAGRQLHCFNETTQIVTTSRPKFDCRKIMEIKE